MKNRTKGTLLSPLFIGVYAAVLARVCKDLENIYYTRCDVCVCVCVCVSKISEIDKYKALKSKEESKSLCIVLLLLMLFVVTILSCSDIILLT